MILILNSNIFLHLLISVPLKAKALQTLSSFSVNQAESLSRETYKSSFHSNAKDDSRYSSEIQFCHHNSSGSENYSLHEIPTFSSVTFDYSLTKFSIRRDAKEFKCTRGKLSPVHGSISIEAFLEGLQNAGNYANSTSGHPASIRSYIFTTLRNSTILLRNGVGDANNILSVGFEGAAYYVPPENYCVQRITGRGTRAVVHFKVCMSSLKQKQRPTYRKCCPVGMFLHKKKGMAGCKGFNYTANSLLLGGKYFLAVGDKYQLVESEKVKPFILSRKLGCDKDLLNIWRRDGCDREFYPTTDNRVAYVGAHRDWKFLEEDDEFCLDVLENEQDVLVRCAATTGNATAIRKGHYHARVSLIYMIMISAYIGALFHAITTIAYLITWRKQNVHGKTLCSCTASLALMHFFLGSAHLLGKMRNQRKTWFCIANGIFAQLFILSAFTWLLVVNIDLWRTFRKIRLDDQSKDSTRFRKYLLFGWGFPLLVVIISICMEVTFSCRVTGVPVPEYGDELCLVAPWAQGFYVYYILTILVVGSVTFAALTMCGLYNYKKDTNDLRLRSTKNVTDKHKMFLFLKLGILMGLTWAFEVISWATTREDEVSHVVWLIIDLYNALSSVIIFILFVLKNKQFKDLSKGRIFKKSSAPGAAVEVANTRL